MDYFSQMPPEIIHQIFFHLDLTDLFNVRLVNKKWKNIASDFKINEVFFYYLKRIKDNWFFTNRPIRLEYLIDHSKIFCLKGQLFNFQHLKRLKISRFQDEICLNDINKFVHLEQLDIILMYTNVGECNNKLKLPNLQKLNITTICIELNKTITIDTPKLEFIYLGFHTIDSLVFVHKDQVKYLYFNGSYQHRVLQFRNLETFQCVYTNCLENEEILRKLTKLKEIRVIEDSLSSLNVLENIQKQNDDKKRQLDIYYLGIKLSTNREINETIFETEKTDISSDSNRLYLLLKNYSDLCSNLYWMREIRYDDILKTLGNVPADLNSKFVNIRELEIRNPIDDQESFVNFIKNCKNLHRLLLHHSKLGQEFYDLLPSLDLQLIDLDMIEKEVNLNFSFVFRIKYLEIFSVNQYVNLNYQNMNLNSLVYLKEFSFKLNKNNYIDIVKVNRNRFNFKRTGSVYKENLSFAGLLNWINHVNDDQYDELSSLVEVVKKIKK